MGSCEFRTCATSFKLPILPLDRGTHPLLSFLNSKMMSNQCMVPVPHNLVAAGAGAILFAISSPLTARIYTDHTAEGKTQALKKLLAAVKAEHETNAKELLPKLPLANQEQFPEIHKRSFMLSRWDRHSTLLDRNHLTFCLR